MEKTAVEWLADQIQEQLDIFCTGGILCSVMIEQAKAMEKEQIVNAASWTPEDGLSILSELAEQYYNETFKKEE